MSSAVDATGNPIPTSAVLTASAKHIGMRCMPENVAFLKCKKNDPNPEKCLDKGRDVTRCVLGLYVSLAHYFSFYRFCKFSRLLLVDCVFRKPCVYFDEDIEHRMVDLGF